MQKFLSFHLLQSFLFLNFCLGSSIPKENDPTSCGKFQLQPPFLSSSNLNGPFPLNHMILCRSQKLYFRTSIGVFPISKIDYTTKTLIISNFLSSSHHFVSPSLLSSGLPSPPHLINSLLLFNCSNPTKPITESAHNCPKIVALQNQDEEQISQKVSCLIFEDLGKLQESFHPNDLKCSHFRRVYRNSSDVELKNGYKLGTSISFDIPDHVPNLCHECEKPDGHCGVGLRCICHVLECKDKVFSKGGIVRPGGKILISLMAVFVVIIISM
uniref:Transmembrane protein n=1 Tax=Cucumis melo TaxID=3656 RepID=A0A9I9CK13_CUCME